MGRAMVARSRWSGVAALLGLGWATWATDARANVPQYLTEQGRLFDASGNPVAVAVTMEFNLYEAATGGTSLWTETQTITPDSGYFSAVLASATPFPANIFATAATSGQTLFLGVKVNTDAEIAPRQPLQSVPYALVADNAVGNINPTTVTVGGTLVINNQGKWVGSPTGLVGPTGPAGEALGRRGRRGARELRGRRGRRGARELRGRRGRRGAPEVRGRRGRQGAPEVRGRRGRQGAPEVRGWWGRLGTTERRDPPDRVGLREKRGERSPRSCRAAITSWAR